MNGGGAAGRDLRERFLFNGCQDNFEALCASSIQNQERKFSVPGNESEFVLCGHNGQWSMRNGISYLMTPLSEDSINRMSRPTSSPRSPSVFGFSRSFVLFILDASSLLEGW